MRLTPVGSERIGRGLATEISQTSGKAFIRFYLYVETMPFAAVELFTLGGITSSTRSVQLIFNSDGKFTINHTQGAGSQGQAVLVPGRWFRVELDCTVHSTAGAATLTVFAGDSTVALITQSMSGNNTDGNGTVSDFYFGAQADLDVSVDYFVDDIAINDDGGTFQDGLPGPGAVILLGPISAVTTDWQKSLGGIAILVNIDDVPGTPSDGQFNLETNTTDVDRWGLDDLSSLAKLSGPPVLVDCYARIGGNETTGPARSMILRFWDEGGASSDGPSIDTKLNGSRNLSTDEHLVVDVTAKVAADVDSFDTGCKANTGSNREKRCSSHWVNYEYLPDIPSLVWAPRPLQGLIQR